MNKIEKLVLELMAERTFGGVLTIDEMVEKLMDIAGTQKMGLILVTEPSMRKTGNPWAGKVKKVARSLVDININYENRVNNQREREGSTADFEVGDNWHEAIKDSKGRWTPFTRNKKSGEMYLRCAVDKSLSTTYVDDTGDIVPKESLEPFLTVRRPAVGQGLEKEIKFICPKLTSVRGISTGGKTYLVGT